MKSLSIAGAVIGLLLGATALTPVGAADMSFERALNADREPVLGNGLVESATLALEHFVRDSILRL